MSDIVARLRQGHAPRPAEMDQTGGPDGYVCHHHGWGYPPAYPCLEVEAADEIELLRSVLRRMDITVNDPRPRHCHSADIKSLNRGSWSHWLCVDMDVPDVTAAEAAAVRRALEDNR